MGIAEARRPTRVVLTYSHALPNIGGIQVLLDKEVRALAAAGAEVALVTSDLGGSGQTPVYPPSVRVIRLPASDYLQRRFGLFFPVFGPSLLTTLWQEVRRADVVHGHGFIAPGTVAAMVIGRIQGKPTVLTEHNGVQPRRSRLAGAVARLAAEVLGRLAVRAARRCVTYNSRVERLLHRFGGPRKAVAFVPYPVDRSLFRPPTPGERREARAALGWADGRKKVLFVGRLVREKGIPLLLEAADPAAFDVVFCGSGDPAVLGPLPRPGVEYLPPRPQAELVRVYHAADALVLPSYVEGFPLVAREAMACGLPTVLGYDPGYEPYRALPLLSFCELTPGGVRVGIAAALAGRDGPGEPADPRFDADPVEWVRRVYGEFLGSSNGS